MKKFTTLILAFVLLLANTACGTNGGEEKKLKFGKNGEFKILVLADTQDYAEPHQRMMDFIVKMLDETKPDIIVFPGDNVIETNEEKFRKGAKALLAPLNERGIPYAYTFGNHDDEFGMTKEQMKNIFESIGDCRTVDSAPGITGVGNCVLEVASSDGERTAYYLWMIDSNSYDSEVGGYDHLHDDQLDWIKSTAAELKAKNGDVPSMFFQHIVPAEAFDLLIESSLPAGTEGTHEYRGKNYALHLKEGARGYLGEFPCPPSVPTDEIGTLVEIGGVVGVISGHDHSNAFVGNVRGIDLIQCPGMTFADYGDDICRGCRLITLHEGSMDYDTKLYTYD